MSGAAGSSRTPYFLRAFYEWACDAGLTPQIIVNAQAPGAAVPEGYAKDGRIVFNLSAAAVRNLRLGNEAVEFEARFGGVARSVYVPVGAVLGVYALETGEGIAFRGEDAPAGETETEPSESERNASGHPRLKVVK